MSNQVNLLLMTNVAILGAVASLAGLIFSYFLTWNRLWIVFYGALMLLNASMIVYGLSRLEGAA